MNAYGHYLKDSLTMQNVAQQTPDVTPAFQSSYNTKYFEARSRTEIQSEQNDLLLRELSQENCPQKRVGFVVGLLTAIGHAEPGEIVSRSRIAIAERLTFQGSQAERLKHVTDNLNWLKTWQRKIGKEFVSINSGAPGRSPEFCPHVNFLNEQAIELKKKKPGWRWNPNQTSQENAERRSAITENAGEWVRSQLPVSSEPPELEKPEPIPLSLKEYHKRCKDDLERFAEKRATHAEETYFEHREILLEEMANTLWKMAKAEKARRRYPAPESTKNGNMYKESTRAAVFPGEDFETEPVFEDYESLNGDHFENPPEAPTCSGNAPYPPMLTSFPATKFDELTEVSSPENGSDELSWEDLRERIRRQDASAEANFWDPEREALRALDLNESVGVEAPLEVTCLDDTPLPDGKRRAHWNRKNPGRDQTRQNIGEWLEDALRLKASLIVRPVGSPRTGEVRPIFQIDDVDLETAERLEPFCYWQVETSPGNYQSWHALSDVQGATAEERYSYIETTLDGVLLALRAQGLKGNKGSHGSVRWPGSRNFKKEPVDRKGCPVLTRYGKKGNFTSRSELEAAGLFISPPAPIRPALIPPPGPPPPLVDSSVSEPDYECEREWATLRGTNRHGADQSWSNRAAAWKNIDGDFAFSREQIEQRLYQLSDKAKELKSPGKYVATTVDNAFRRVGRN